MPGYVDLHCHYLPGIDDGVRTLEEGVALCQGLHGLGYARVVATPHIRTAMYDNRKPGLEAAYARFRDATAATHGMPHTGLGAEHYFDDVFWDLFVRGEAVPYPGGKAALVEFPSEGFPARVDHRLFEMQVRGVRPVIAHPERYPTLFRRTDPLDPLLDVGGLPLLDVMSLAGRYGRRPRKAAERMLEEGVYFAACSDAHRPTDVDTVAEALDRLRSLVGDSEAETLLSDHPRRILEGRVET
jgi:protein-tyrosine phosphatase